MRAPFKHLYSPVVFRVLDFTLNYRQPSKTLIKKKGRESMVPTSQYDTHKPKELRRFYEPLGILYELTLRDQMKPRSVFSVSAGGISIMQRRRDFVDSIAFIGAYSKECEIAVALERQPDLLIVRVAGHWRNREDRCAFSERPLDRIVNRRKVKHR
jgi:hypothetical protein